MDDPFDSEEFDHLCYAYRMAPGHKPQQVAAAFEAVCEFGRRALRPHTASDRQGFEPFEYTERS